MSPFLENEVEKCSGRTPGGTWYELTGPVAADVVVLVHGVGLDLYMWDAQVDALTPEFRVLRYDVLGHGRTPPDPQAAKLADFARQLLDLLRHLALERIVLVGFSLGGVIAQRFAADHPRYLKGLVLMNTVYRRRPEELRGVSERLRQTEKHGPAVNADAAIERWFTPSFRTARPDVTAAVRRRLISNDATGYVCAYRVFVEADRAIGNALTAVTCPTLVITGTQDVGSTPEMARRMSADLHDAKVVLLEGLRHMAPVEDPERMNTALLDFLHTLA